MPSLPIIDSHVHLWDPTRFHMPWLDDIPLLRRPIPIQEYREQTMGLLIEAIISMSSECHPEETLWWKHRSVVQQAQQNQRSPLIWYAAAAPIGKAPATQLFMALRCD